MQIPEEGQKENKSSADYGMVSIIMPNYNCEKYIEATIKSVLAQTYQNWELLFVDDCSTDRSLPIVRAFADERIKILTTPKNSGAAIARNVGIELASGKWMAFLDSDDAWFSEKLEKQIAYMHDNNFAFSFSDYEVIGENDERISIFRPHLDVCSYKDILKHNHIGCLTAIYNTEKLGKVFMPVEAEKREDVACWLKILKQGVGAHCLHECLAQYKLHSNSVSSNKLKMMKYQWQVYRKAESINIFKSLYYMAHWAIWGVLKYR